MVNAAATTSSSQQTTTVELPKLQVFLRIREIPMIELVLAKSASTYSRVKNSHQLLHWVLSSAENSLYSATSTAVPIAAPLVRKFQVPIEYLDRNLCLGLDKIQTKIPIVNDSPEQVYEKSYNYARQTVQPAISTISYANQLIISSATTFKINSWNKANDIIATHYGTVAIDKFDSTAIIVDKLIDKYFPATEAELTEPTSSEEDRLLNTLKTVGRLSNKAAHRVYSNVVVNLRTINKDRVKIYIANVVEFLHIAQYLDAVNNRVQRFVGPTRKTKQNGNANGHAKFE